MAEGKKYCETRDLEELRLTYRVIMNDLSDSMTRGSCTDFADYRHQCGVIYGLALAERDLLILDGELVNR